MHYCCEVWVNKNAFNTSDPSDRLKEAQELLSSALHRYNYNNSNSKSTLAFYDYFVIGGRWTGNHDGYDPGEDYRNYKKCTLCINGVREDLKASTRGCNECLGTGMDRQWNNIPHPEDAMELSKVLPDITSYSLIIINPKLKRPQIFRKEIWNDILKKFESLEFNGKVIPFLKKKGITDGYLITVDYHS